MTTTILTQAGFVSFENGENKVYATVSGMSVSAAVNQLSKSQIIELGESNPETVNGCKYIGNGKVFKIFKHKARAPHLWNNLEEAIEMSKKVAKSLEVVSFFMGQCKIATMKGGIVRMVDNPLPQLI
jgi:hypothetical protein